MIYKVIIFVVLCIVQQALAITYTFDLSAGDASQVTRCCGGPDYKKGSWKFANASLEYGWQNGTIYTTNGPACIRPKQSLRFTNNSWITVRTYINATDGNYYYYEVYIVNKERNQRFFWYQYGHSDDVVGRCVVVDSLNRHVNSTQQPWIFNNENYLELIFPNWHGLREIIFENVEDD